MKTPRNNRMGVPPRRNDILFVQSPDAGQRFRFLCYSPVIQGFYTHYSGRTVPCYKNHLKCPGGHSLLNRRWKGYLHGWSHARNEPIFLQLTPEAANQLLDQLAEGATLRGLMIEVSRSAKKKGRMSCVLGEAQRAFRSVDLPPPLDCRRSCYNLWDLPYTDEEMSTALDGDDEEEIPPPTAKIA